MGSKSYASVALFLALNLLFFSLVTATGCSCHPKPKPKPTPKPKTPKSKPPPTPTTPPAPPTPPTPVPTPPKSKPPPTPTTPPAPKPTPPTPPTPVPTPPCPTPPTPTPPAPTPTPTTSCPRDTLKLGVCANLLGGLVGVVIGTPANSPCCSLIQGLADLDAALCLCTAIKANILGINLNVPISLSLILTACGKEVPSGFKCA